MYWSCRNNWIEESAVIADNLKIRKWHSINWIFFSILTTVKNAIVFAIVMAVGPIYTISRPSTLSIGDCLSATIIRWVARCVALYFAHIIIIRSVFFLIIIIIIGTWNVNYWQGWGYRCSWATNTLFAFWSNQYKTNDYNNNKLEAMRINIYFS